MNFFEILVIGFMIISFATVIIAVYYRDSPKSLNYTYLAICIAIYMLGYFLEVNSVNFETAYMATVVEYIGLPFIQILSIFFLMDCYEVKINKIIKTVMLLISLGATVLVITWPINGIFYKSAEFVPGPPLARLKVEGSSVYNLIFIYFFICLLANLILVLYYATKRPKGHRKAELVNAIAIILPFFSTVLYVAGFTPYGYDFNPIAMAGSSLLFAFSIFKLNLMQLLPLAKAKILDRMNDAFIVVDNDELFLDANLAAKKLFPGLENVPFATAISDIKGLPVSEDGTVLQADQEYMINQHGSLRYYRISRSDVFSKNKKICTCIILYDATETQRLLKELHQMATYDSLTAIYNRGTFLQIGTLMIEEAKKEKNTIVALMCDLDHFKLINDTYGHIYGDKVLFEVAQRIKNRLRKSDIFGRYGGEEFGIILSGIDEDNVASITENIRTTICDQPFVFDDLELILTISIGAAVFNPEKHSNLENLMSDADKALYEAKNAGRNKIVIH